MNGRLPRPLSRYKIRQRLIRAAEARREENAAWRSLLRRRLRRCAFVQWGAGAVVLGGLVLNLWAIEVRLRHQREAVATAISELSQNALTLRGPSKFLWFPDTTTVLRFEAPDIIDPADRWVVGDRVYSGRDLMGRRL